MPHHWITWPFKKIDDWLRTYYQNKQLKELIAIQEKDLFLRGIPEIDVSVRLIPSPDPPRRTDIPIVDVVVHNYGGTAHITEGTFWISFSDRQAKEEEKYIVDVQMPKGKEEKFFFYVILQFFSKVVERKSALKFHYDIHFEGADGEPQESKRSYTYDPDRHAFISDEEYLRPTLPIL
jgi:hypothetical protein